MQLRRVRHHLGNSLFRPKNGPAEWATEHFRETRMATGIERSRRPKSPSSRPQRRGRLRHLASAFKPMFADAQMLDGGCLARPARRG